MKHEKFTITGMSCSACSTRVEKAVNKLDGIDKASVNLLTNSMQADYAKTSSASKISSKPSSTPAMVPARQIREMPPLLEELRKRALLTWQKKK